MDVSVQLMLTLYADVTERHIVIVVMRSVKESQNT